MNVDIWQQWTVGIGLDQTPRGADADFRNGSWPSKNTLPREVGEKPEPARSQAPIAAMSGLVPTMFMTRVRL